MRPGHVIFLAFLGLMLGGFALIWFWSEPQIEAGGLELFDTRPAYDLDDARAFLDALTAAGRAAYLGPQRLADTIFPIGLTGVLASLIVWGFWGWLGRAAMLLALVPLGYFSFDMLENARVAGLLRSDPASLSAAQVARASAATGWKFLLVDISIGLAVLSLVARALGWLFARRRRA